MEQIDKYFENIIPFPLGQKKFIKEQSLIISFFNYHFPELDELHELDIHLEKVVEEAKIGFYDGHEINMDGPDGTLYLYGPDAGKLFDLVKPILENTKWMKGAVATLDFGGPVDNPNHLEIEIEVRD